MSIHSCAGGCDGKVVGEDPILRPAAYSPRETERLLGVSHATVYRLIAAELLDARKLGAKTLISASSIETLLASLPKIQKRVKRGAS
jgi:excisionase family DNA binding protein